MRSSLFLPRRSSDSAAASFSIPTNYSQNVLTAARELQQVNNELQSLENQATSLVNQARNLTSLPYSSLSTLDQSILQTEQLLTQAQRIAYNVSTIDQAFTPDLSRLLSRLDLLAAIDGRRPDPLAELAGGVSGRDARPGGRGPESQQHPHPDRRAHQFQPVGNRRAAGGAVGQSTRRHSRPQQLADLTAVMAAIARAQSLEGARNVESEEQAQAQTNNFLNYGAGYQPGSAQMFH